MDRKFLTNIRLVRPLPKVFITSYYASFGFFGVIIAVMVLLPMLSNYSRTDLVSSGHGRNQNDRKEFINQTCMQRHWSRGIDLVDRQYFWRLLVDDKHELLYCVIPKAACSSFKTYIAKATGRVRSGRVRVHSVRYINSLGIGYLNQPMTGSVDHKLANYCKFIVVRHPFDRLLSAYNDKFLHQSFYPRAYSKLILRTFVDKIIYDDSGVIRISLSQFLTLIAKYYSHGFADRHWQSYYDLCHPCDIKYDNIIKLETLDQDLPAFTSHYTDISGRHQTFPVLNTARNGNNKLEEVTRVFSAVDPVIINALLSIYHKDFTLFGYTWSAEKGAGYL